MHLFSWVRSRGRGCAGLLTLAMPDATGRVHVRMLRGGVDPELTA